MKRNFAALLLWLACTSLFAAGLEFSAAEQVYRTTVKSDQKVLSWSVATGATISAVDAQSAVIYGPAGTYRVEATYADGSSGVFASVTFGQPPKPQPKPVPPKPTPTPPAPPKPVDPPAPAPIPLAGIHAIIVEETAERAKLPAGQKEIILSNSVGSVRQWLLERAAKDQDGKSPAVRILDKDIDVSNDYQVWQDAMKRPRGSLPWWVISDGTKGIEGPLPSDPASALKILNETFPRQTGGGK